MDLDPNLIGLFVNYAANVAADATRYAAGRLSRALRKEAPEAPVQADQLNLSIQAELAGRGVEGANAVKIARYILNDSNLSFLLLLCVTAVRRPEYASQAMKEIEAHLVLEAQVDDDDLAVSTDVVFSILDTVARMQEARSLTGNTAASSSRQRPQQLGSQELFGDQVARLEFFRAVGRPSLQEVAAYTKRYLDYATETYSAIQLQHLGEGRAEVALESVYVPPLYNAFAIDGPSASDPFTSAHLLSRSQRLVVLGPAGSGKSTTVRHAAALIASRLEAGPVPFVIELKSYAGDIAGHPKLFIEHLRERITIALQQEPPEHWMEYLLLSGRAVVFFDGFDEVLNAGRRTEIRDAVRGFGRLFPSCSLVITSRITGYELAPLHESEYFHAQICELSEGQVAHYAEQWFSLRNAQDRDAASRNASSFLIESKQYAGDLRVNPLMLSLLCSVYYLRGDIPRTLSDLYERCAGLIYQQWHTMRGIDDHHAWDQNLRPALYHIANLVLSNDEYLSEGVPREVLVSELRSFFMSEGAADPIEATRVARETLDIWAGRAWIITAVSSDEEQRPRFGFVHQSFLEYFAAIHVVRRSDNALALHEALRDRLIYLNGWSVAQIAASTFDKWRDRGGDQYLNAIIEDAGAAPDSERFALLRFGVSLLDLVTIRPATEQALVTEILTFFASTLQLGDGRGPLHAIHSASRERSLAYRLLTQDDPDALLESGYFVEVDEKSDQTFAQLHLSSLEADAVVQQLLVRALDSKRLLDCIVNVLRQEFTADGNDHSTLASLYVYAVMRSEQMITEELEVELASIAQGRDSTSHWTVLAGLVAAELVPADAVAESLPWHVFVIREPLVLSYTVDFSTPQLIPSDLAAVVNDPGPRIRLRAFGAALLAAARETNGITAIPLAILQDSFVLVPPEETWPSVSGSGDWDDLTLLGFAGLARLAQIGWTSAQAFEELYDPYENPIVGAVIEHVTGTHQVTEEHVAALDPMVSKLLLDIFRSDARFVDASLERDTLLVRTSAELAL